MESFKFPIITSAILCPVAYLGAELLGHSPLFCLLTTCHLWMGIWSIRVVQELPQKWQFWTLLLTTTIIGLLQGVSVEYGWADDINNYISGDYRNFK